MKKIGRPRKQVRKENISVNLPTALIAQIHDELSWKSSRSYWIEDAIRRKLGKTSADITSFTLQALLWEAKNRPDCDPNVKFVIQMYLDSTVKSPNTGKDVTEFQ